MTFEEYYQHYLSLHQNVWCRRLHVLGQLATIAYGSGVIYFAITVSWWLLFLLAFLPFVVYPFAWSGHFIFEHNKPAAFKNPWLAKLSDWRMLWDIICGRIPF